MSYDYNKLIARSVSCISTIIISTVASFTCGALASLITAGSCRPTVMMDGDNENIRLDINIPVTLPIMPLSLYTGMMVGGIIFSGATSYIENSIYDKVYGYLSYWFPASEGNTINLNRDSIQLESVIVGSVSEGHLEHTTDFLC